MQALERQTGIGESLVFLVLCISPVFPNPTCLSFTPFPVPAVSSLSAHLPLSIYLLQPCISITMETGKTGYKEDRRDKGHRETGETGEREKTKDAGETRETKETPIYLWQP